MFIPDLAAYISLEKWLSDWSEKQESRHGALRLQERSGGYIGARAEDLRHHHEKGPEYNT